MKIFAHVKFGFKTYTKVKQVQNLFSFVVDKFVELIVMFFFPIPLAGKIAVYFKIPILSIATMFLVCIFFMFTSVFAFVFLPTAFAQSLFFNYHAPGDNKPIDSGDLQNYREDGFNDTQTPTKSPFGGSSMENTILTEGFLDPDYAKRFGMPHYGIDLVPSDNYYKTNKAFLLTKQVVMFATNNGKVNSYVDSYGALTIEIINDDQTVKTVYKHLKDTFLTQDQTVQAGQPVGIMGDTGFAFGEHLHYEVRLNENNDWNAVNPINYIN